MGIPGKCVPAVTTLHVGVYLAPHLRVKEARIAHSSLLCSGMRLVGKAVNLGFHGGLKCCQAVVHRVFDNSLWRAGWSHANCVSSLFLDTKLQRQEPRVT